MTAFPLCVIGVGPAGRNYLRELLKDWRIAVVGFVNRSPDRRAAVQQETGVPGFATLDDLLSGVARQPRLAVIASANPTHKDFTLACLARGLDVFCEKPMAMTVADCEAMLAAERASGRALQIGFEYRYGSMTRRLKELQEQGWFGEVRAIDIVDSRGHWWPERPDTAPADVWRLNCAIGGGPLLHCGIHELDLMRHYAGEVAEAQAFVAPNALAFYPRDMPDHLTLQLRFAGGAAGSLTLRHDVGSTWYRPQPAWVPKYHAVPGHGLDLAITGTRGMALAQIYREELHLARYDHDNRETVFERTESFHHHHPDRTHHDTTGMIVRFALNLRDGKGALHAAEDSYRTTRLGLACEELVQAAIADGWASPRRTFS